MNPEHQKLSAPDMCADLPTPATPPESLMEEYLKLSSDPSTRVFDRGRSQVEDRHPAGYLSADGHQNLSVLLKVNPNTGNEVPLSITDTIHGQSDDYNVTTGSREGSIWEVRNNNGHTDYTARIDSRSGLVQSESGEFFDLSDNLISRFAYTFNPDGSATSCYEGDALSDIPDKRIWSMKP